VFKVDVFYHVQGEATNVVNNQHMFTYYIEHEARKF